MKFIKDNILFIAIVLLVLWLYFLVKPTYLPRVPNGFDISKFKKVQVIHDTEYQKVYINKYKKGDSIPYKLVDTIYTHISDTIRILADYSQVKAYSDTIKKLTEQVKELSNKEFDFTPIEVLNPAGLEHFTFLENWTTGITFVKEEEEL